MADPVARNDTIITDFKRGTAFSIPEWVLLRNDSDADGDPLSITRLSKADSVTLGKFRPTKSDDDPVTIIDDKPKGGSFRYTVSDGTDTAKATVKLSIGSDILYGSDETDDIIVLDPRASAAFAYAGDDIVFGNDLGNTLGLYSGVDYVEAGGGDDNVYFEGLDPLDYADGGDGEDWLSLTLSDGDDTFSSDSGRFVNFEGLGIVGGPGDDTITTGDGWDRLFGDEGNDTLRGRSGPDEINGGDGKDRLYGGSGKDALTGGSGKDTLEGGGGRDRLYGNAGDDTLDGGSGRDKLWGGADDDKLSGGGGDDRLNGGDGKDHLFGNSGDDTLDGGSGRDKLRGGSDNDSLTGDGGNDNLSGGSGRDELRGGGGDDTIVGSRGADDLNGNSGDDTFIYRNTGHGGDIIRGFDKKGDDTIDLTGIDADEAIAGNQDLIWGGKDSDTLANTLTWHRSGDTAYVHADTDGDTVADFELTVFIDTNLTGSDFLF